MITSSPEIRVSIIVVSYNHSGFITECLDSIKRQNYPNWELIVADDASKDNSIEVFNGWLDDNKVTAKKIFNKKNQGFCRTLNACIAQCEGDLVKILAADDFLHDNYLSEVVSEFESRGSDTGLVYSNAEYVNEYSIKQHTNVIGENPELGDGYIYDQLLMGNMIPALTVTMRMEAVKTIGPFNEHIWIEDWEYWLRLSKRFKIHYINKILAYYRQHGSNVSGNFDKLTLGEWQILISNIGDIPEKRWIVNLFVRNRYFYLKNKAAFRKKLEHYRYLDPVLRFIIKFNLPRRMYRFYEEFFQTSKKQ